MPYLCAWKKSSICRSSIRLWAAGSFWVNAANLIANFITEILNEIPFKATGKRHGLLRRWVVENCIYGVDLNPLAVELAKPVHLDSLDGEGSAAFFLEPPSQMRK